MSVSFNTLTCYKDAAMPKKVEQSKDDVLGVAVTLDRKKLVREIATKEDRSLSYIGGKLLERGLAAYLRDGLLNEQAQADQPQRQSTHQTEPQAEVPRVTEVNIVKEGMTKDQKPHPRARAKSRAVSEVEEQYRDRPADTVKEKKRQTS